MDRSLVSGSNTVHMPIPYPTKGEITCTSRVHFPTIPNHLSRNIPQTPILTNPHRPSTLPFPTPRNRRARNDQLTNRLALPNFRIRATDKFDFHTAKRRAKAAVLLAAMFALLLAVVENVRLANSACDRGCCEGVDDAGAREDSQVGEHG